MHPECLNPAEDYDQAESGIDVQNGAEVTQVRNNAAIRAAEVTLNAAIRAAEVTRVVASGDGFRIVHPPTRPRYRQGV